MRTQQGQKKGLRVAGESRQIESACYGAGVTCSATISGDSCVPSFVPFWAERRQIEHAAKWSSTIPCFRHLRTKLDFPFWIQPVAAEYEEHLRRLNMGYTRPEKIVVEMADYRHDSYGLHVFPKRILEDQDAAFMANSEVSTCR